MPARVPRPLVPTARSSLAVVVMAALLGAALGLSSRPAAPLPAFSLPVLGEPAPTEPVVSEALQAAVPQWDDVLPLGRDLAALPDAALGPLSNQEAAAAWPDPVAARRWFDSWGRTGGFQVTYVRPGPTFADRPVVQVWADASGYRSAEGAADALRDLGQRLAAAGAVPADAPALLDASAAYWQTEGSLATVHLLLRRGSIAVWLAVTGLAERLRIDDASLVARAIAERLEADRP